jgi:hypothetical protein
MGDLEKKLKTKMFGNLGQIITYLNNPLQGAKEGNGGVGKSCSSLLLLMMKVML